MGITTARAIDTQPHGIITLSAVGRDVELTQFVRYYKDKTLKKNFKLKTKFCKPREEPLNVPSCGFPLLTPISDILSIF